MINAVVASPLSWSWLTDSPSWMIYFAVADTDLTAARAAELGGTVSVEPFDLFNVGRVAVLNDPEGASFSILQWSE
jgi:uncharacterized protein